MVEIRRPAPGRKRLAAADDIAANVGGYLFTMAEDRWSALRPDLSAEVTALLAPPVVVRVAAFPSVPTRPAGRHRVPDAWR
jgi:hypothetical protein